MQPWQIPSDSENYIIKEVCESLWKTMAPLHMPSPTTKMLLATSNEFYLKWNFPNSVGSIDGKLTAEVSINFR